MPIRAIGRAMEWPESCPRRKLPGRGQHWACHVSNKKPRQGLLSLPGFSSGKAENQSASTMAATIFVAVATYSAMLNFFTTSTS